MNIQFYPPRTLILPLTIIRRERMLPWQGEVLSRVGQRVEPSDVVARAGRPRDHLLLDVAKKFDITSKEAQECILKLPGEPVHQGETLAKRKEGFFGTRKITSPVEGRITAITAGRMLVRPAPDLYELRALIPGMVANISPSFGATIETPGALIQGMWGSSKEGYGVLKMGVAKADGIMTADQIDVSHHGTILVCGATISMELLERAQELQVRGIITGGVPARHSWAISQQVLPVIATNGIGSIPISKPIFNLLLANEGREIVIIATSPDRWQANRPEIIIPLPATTSPEMPPQPGKALRSGQVVRILRAPHKGAIGKVKTVHNRPRSLENGIKAPGADVVLDDGTTVFVPYVNLDLIES
ncbi:MAG: hypothetical protein JXA42_01635 [Anaerolineales bacterium]|nr:hypothetical protein [Anaerolineales bacterium]